MAPDAGSIDLTAWILRGSFHCHRAFNVLLMFGHVCGPCLSAVVSSARSVWSLSSCYRCCGTLRGWAMAASESAP